MMLASSKNQISRLFHVTSKAIVSTLPSNTRSQRRAPLIYIRELPEVSKGLGMGLVESRLPLESQ